MEPFKNIIDKQIASNENKNLFYSGISRSFGFIQETIDAIEKIAQILPKEEEHLIDHTSSKVFQEFCKINQYYSFNKQSLFELRNVYRMLFINLKEKKLSIQEVEEQHYHNLVVWLKKNNPFAEKLYNSSKENVEPVACSQYTPQLQVKVLQIDLENINEPILDVGCGENGYLVKHLHSLGYEAFGFDRLIKCDHESKLFENANWLEYNFGVKKWGTIISHLGFTNHFQHHHLREDGEYIAYAKKYMEILNSLKSGGSFHYTPDLPFIEQYLDPNVYQIDKNQVENFDFYAIKIVKK